MPRPAQLQARQYLYAHRDTVTGLCSSVPNSRADLVMEGCQVAASPRKCRDLEALQRKCGDFQRHAACESATFAASTGQAVYVGTEES